MYSLPYFIFIEAVGLMPLYQFNTKLVEGITKMFQSSFKY